MIQVLGVILAEMWYFNALESKWCSDHISGIPGELGWCEGNQCRRNGKGI